MLAVVQARPYLLTKMLTAILLILNDDKKTERHRAVDKNTPSQDSVHLFSFKQQFHDCTFHWPVYAL